MEIKFAFIHGDGFHGEWGHPLTKSFTPRLACCRAYLSAP